MLLYTDTHTHILLFFFLHINSPNNNNRNELTKRSTQIYIWHNEDNNNNIDFRFIFIHTPFDLQNEWHPNANVIVFVMELNQLKLNFDIRMIFFFFCSRQILRQDIEKYTLSNFIFSTYSLFTTYF